MVYGIFSGYNEPIGYGYKKTLDEAEKYCAVHNQEKDWLDRYYIIPLNEIDGDTGLEDVQLHRHYTFTFDFEDGTIRTPAKEYEFYVKGIKNIEFECFPRFYFRVHLTANTKEEARDVAEIIYKEFKECEKEYGTCGAVSILQDMGLTYIERKY